MERPESNNNSLKRLYNWLNFPIDNSGLVLFRIVFGLLLFLEAFGANLTGWVNEVFVESPFTFTFIGFEFLSILHGEWMPIYYVIMSLAGLMIMLGFKYRLGVLIYFFMWSGVYFAQKAHYNNHYYFTLLLLGILFFLPANGYLSFDKRKNKELTTPRWTVLFFIVQVGILYFFGGLAKCNSDWVAIQPISIWFDAKSEYTIIGPLLAQEWFKYFIAWGGIFFDLLIAPFLLWNKTRKIAFVTCVLFHLFNSAVFQVGIFPFLGILLCVFFFPQESIRQLFFRKKAVLTDAVRLKETKSTNKWFLVLLGVYLLWQIYLPLRHWFYPGNVYWNEEGHRLAWQMMARTKYGTIDFRIVNNQTGDEFADYPSLVLSAEQNRTLPSKPDMIWQYVQFMKTKYNPDGNLDLSIYANGKCSLNGRPLQPFVDPKIDLAKVSWNRFEHKDWILPLEE